MQSKATKILTVLNCQKTERKSEGVTYCLSSPNLNDSVEATFGTKVSLTDLRTVSARKSILGCWVQSRQIVMVRGSARRSCFEGELERRTLSVLVSQLRRLH
jgi:hypothetical protein